MSSGTRYFLTDRWPIVVSWEEEDTSSGYSNTHVLLDPSDVENSDPKSGFTETDEAGYAIALAQAQADAQADLDAQEAANLQAAEDAYNDLVASGVSPATASALTGHTP